MDRTLSFIDHAVGTLDQGLRLLLGPPPVAERPTPGAEAAEAPLDPAARDSAARLMRVNHAGEISAQALYQGQALAARAPDLREKLERAAREENDHLAWTAERVRELGGRASWLDPLWYAGSLAIGAGAGLAGDRRSLGFLAETERQVVAHLEGHLGRLPPEDRRSRAIVEQMRDDEGRHATTAIEAGASELPQPVKTLMRLSARMMTTTAYWI